MACRAGAIFMQRAILCQLPHGSEAQVKGAEAKASRPN
jgi:hypothetical protein